MSRFPSTVTNESIFRIYTSTRKGYVFANVRVYPLIAKSIFRIPVPTKISCHVSEKTRQQQSRSSLLIGQSGGPLFVFARTVYLT